MKCIYCESKNLVREPSFSDFRTITSDVKPWRRGLNIAICKDCGFPQAEVNDDWQKSASEIYSDYASYYQTSDNDQTVFIDGAASGRGDLFVDSVVQTSQTKQGGAVLDFGCGAGTLLWSFAKLRSDFNLFGFDLDDRELKKLSAIPNFNELLVGELDKNLKFDLISMSHSLEHLVSPIETMKLLGAMLNENGHLVIAVPDCSKDPFKLLIADHCSHFSVPTLTLFLERAGFEVVRIESRIETRECWAVCKPSKTATTSIGANPNTVWVGESVRWLNEVKNHASSLAKSKSFGIFGTSINALWLFGELELDVKFFVDEDPSRVGKKLYGRPVIEPSEVMPGSTVYLPFITTLAEKIAIRLNSRNITWAVPPKSA
jgi:2-polyprenyl-3-methyl-5-hydroxy-6-metoxy-1,4-benzoquinol methylase